MKVMEAGVNPFTQLQQMVPETQRMEGLKRNEEKKPQTSETMKSHGQSFKKMQSERGELIKSMKLAMQNVENFEKNPEDIDKIKYSLDMIEQACFKLRRGVDPYLKSYAALKKEQMLINHGDAEEEWIVSKLREWTCSEGLTLRKCFDTSKVTFNDDNFFEAIKNKVNINVVIKDGYGNIFGIHVACSPSQKHLAILDKTHFIFSLKNVKTPGAAEKQFYPKKMVESFVVFQKSTYVFCVPYAFAIGPYGKSSISPKLERIYTAKGSQFPCSFDDINGTTMPTTFPTEWVKVFVQ